MCKSASFIVLKNGTALHHITDSHREILEANKITDNQTDPQFVACEIVPPNSNYLLPFEQWEFSVDDNFPIPKWYNEQWCKQICIENLPLWAKEHFITDNGCYEINNGKYFVFGDVKPTITVNGGYVRTYGSSAPTITVNGGDVRTFDSSAPTITVNGGYVQTCNSSAPIITVNSGIVRTYGSSAPTITKNN